MKLFTALLTLAVTTATTSASRPLEVHATSVSTTQVIDATHLRRHSKDEIEVVVVQQARGAGQITFLLNGGAVAKLAYADWIRLYLVPRRYRFAIAPSYSFGHAGFWQMNADVSRNTRHLYRIFQSAGFTSSGGNAVYEIAPQ